ncbi:universal stress protein [Sphingomonas sp. ID1715]|uniref:universal stress protein n=1 Tax=Sphingomonas sp. ID1715 TaxID=1656898 RepID=UPI001487E840|nr:universal stress protein [Sphingomonas sp. ID1715]NNM77693.1 universal stress protein [Sphingomonas sp. ID1715]
MTKILALIPEASCTRGCLEAAAAAALVDPGAEIVAFHVRVDPMHIYSSDEEVAFQRLRESQEGTAEARARDARREFEAWLASASPQIAERTHFKEAVGAEEETVQHESAAARLLVMARPRNLDGHDAFHAAVFLSHKPLLLAPAHWKNEAGGRIERHILIAWKQTEQARRAVAGALPWLRKADKVSILTVTKEGQQLDTAKLIETLAAERVAADLLRAESIEGRTSRRLLATAEELGASSLVMGAYRYGSMVEWALGATTRRTIAETTIPLFLAH